MRLRTVIADDEPLARERLRFLLADDEDVVIIGECRNGREVIAVLKESTVDLLFLDIQMPGKSGFEVLEQVGHANMPITVFVTAHNEYAIRAFEVHALDYLTKPVEPSRLHDSLAHVKQRLASKTALLSQDHFKSLLQSLEQGAQPVNKFPKRLLIPNGTKDSFVHVDEIDWIEAADYYSCLHVGSKSLMLREPIKQLIETLDPAKFVRIHRSVIVPVNRVREIVREGRGEGAVILNSGQRLRMSKAGWQSLLAASRS